MNEDYTVYDTVDVGTLEIGDNVILYDEEGNACPSTITDIRDEVMGIVTIDADTDAALEPFRDYQLSWDDEVELWTL